MCDFYLSLKNGELSCTFRVGLCDELGTANAHSCRRGLEVKFSSTCQFLGDRSANAAALHADFDFAIGAVLLEVFVDFENGRRSEVDDRVITEEDFYGAAVADGDGVVNVNRCARLCSDFRGGFTPRKDVCQILDTDDCTCKILLCTRICPLNQSRIEAN